MAALAHSDHQRCRHSRVRIMGGSSDVPGGFLGSGRGDRGWPSSDSDRLCNL